MRYTLLAHTTPEGLRDYSLVFAPPSSLHSLVDAHHSVMRGELERLAPRHWLDSVCFDRLENFYRHILDVLAPGLDPASLVPESRHSFFVTQGLRPDGSPRLSRLQELLGYTEMSDESPVSSSDMLTSGDAVLDVIAELHLLGLPVEWLVQNYSLMDCLSLAQHLWERKSGASTTESGVSQSQREADLALWESIDPEVKEQARQEAITELVFRTGLGAIHGRN